MKTGWGLGCVLDSCFGIVLKNFQAQRAVIFFSLNDQVYKCLACLGVDQLNNNNNKRNRRNGMVSTVLILLERFQDLTKKNPF